MPIEHLPPDTDAGRVASALKRDGCAVIDRLLPTGAREALMSELTPYLDATAPGPDEFSGRRTRRTGGLIARSPTTRELVQHPLLLATVGEVLDHATNYQLHLTQMIAIGPGEPAQAVHRDQWAFDFFPFPSGFEVQCNTLWAMTDFTERNGATRVVPGSHLLEDRRTYREEETEPAEMEAGSVLLYTGALYHGGGANRSDSVRYGLNLTYVVGWLRQEENQYLSVPREIARELPEPLLRLIGYSRGAYALGYVDDLRDPIETLRPQAGSAGFGALESAQGRIAAGRRPR